VNVFITTYDEDVDLVAYSIDAAKKLTCPDNVGIEIFIADDGNRAAMRSMAKNRNVGYITRGDNRGYKAGNLVNALFHCDADFIVICDADTRVFPNFVERTLGYFRDPKVAFVQTPHWFYDIPEGQSHADWLAEKFGNPTRVLAPLFKFISGREKIGADPFLSGSGMFFDVIQRRRNRHNSSFCCGAGSIHRCEALFENAMEEQGTLLSSVAKKAGVDDASNLLPRIDMQPFRYHVSEDIFTSLQQHTRGWRSVYHPEILAAMLSPWSIDAWAMQKLKYAGGTFDILLRTGLVWRRGLPWQTRLHYLGTFWSYLAVVWMPVLFLAPMISLLTGASPVDAYSIEFFLHLLPLLLVNELAISIGAKGHDIHAGRILSIATMGIQLRALVQVLKGDKFHFQPTPKNPIISSSLRYAMPSMIVLVTMACAATYGVWAHYAGLPNHSASLVVVNFFWLGLNALAFIRVVLAAFWRPRLPNGQLLQLSS
jgi:cellulose synthase (UDP-forming)